MANLLTTISPEFDILTQENFLNRQIRDAKQPEYIWRAQARSDMEVYPNKIGIPEIISVRGLRAPNTTPNNVSNLADPNAGISFSGIQYEQFKIQVDRYDGGDYVDMFARNLPIADKFLETYITVAQGAESSQDFIARNVGYATYTGSQSFINATSSNSVIWVDNIFGFQPYTGAQGEIATANVVVGANTYVLASAVANSTHGPSVLSFTDGSFSGTPGYLTFTTPVATADQTVGNLVVAQAAPKVYYANAGTSISNVASGGHALTMKDVQLMKNGLVNNRMTNPTLHAVPDALFGLYQDPEFQLLYRGAYGSDTYKTGEVAKLLGVNIVEVTSAPSIIVNGNIVHLSIMTTDGWLTEARMTDEMVKPEVDGPVHKVVEDNIAILTTAPIDPAGQFTKIVYLQFVGYACRTDRLLTSAVVPTATAANFKRAAVIYSTTN